MVKNSWSRRRSLKRKLEGARAAQNAIRNDVPLNEGDDWVDVPEANEESSHNQQFDARDQEMLTPDARNVVHPSALEIGKHLSVVENVTSGNWWMASGATPATRASASDVLRQQKCRDSTTDLTYDVPKCAPTKRQMSSVDEGCGEPEYKRRVHSSSSTVNTERIPSKNKIDKVKLAFRGRRLVACVSVDSFLEQVSAHGRCCTQFHLKRDYECRSGLDCDIFIRCACGWGSKLQSDTGYESLPSNEALAWGSSAAPVGYQGTCAMMSTLDLPMANVHVFNRHLESGRKHIVKSMNQAMLEAGEEECRLAIDAGEFLEVDGNKYPAITVLVDGGWSKRTYGHSYNANCGVAVIIGARTGKILYQGTRVKTCMLCTRAKNLGKIPKKHKCFLNWTGSSTSMEADIIAEGFRRSISMHNLIFNCFVGDGDSSVFAAVQKVYPGINVEKKECINHVMRNLNKQLNVISKHSPEEERRIPEMEKRFKRIGRDIRCAINHYHEKADRTSEVWKELSNDIVNAPNHVFGDHSRCKPYFCQPERKNEANDVPMMQGKFCWTGLCKSVLRVSTLANSLIEKLTTNCVESFMSVANKYMEGKRKHIGNRGLYELRMACAVLAFNKTTFWPYYAYTKAFGCPPQELWSKQVTQAARTRFRNRKIKQGKRQIKFSFLKPKGDRHYGSATMQPDLPIEKIKIATIQLEQSLKIDPQAALTIEAKTKSQSECPLWFEERRKRITASVAGWIYKLKDTSDNTAILNSILGNGKSISSAATKYGKDMEHVALQQYEERYGPSGQVHPSGLFISSDGIFAASPDGLIGNDGIVEIKCPYNLRNLRPLDWPNVSKDSAIKIIENVPQLKTNHKHYFQVIQQLHVTNREWCDYVVYTPADMIRIRIERNSTKDIWDDMKLKLRSFWENDLAPELVDSRIARHCKTYRCPESRLQSRSRRKQQEKDQPTNESQGIAPP